jgi:hypothetical protein
VVIQTSQFYGGRRRPRNTLLGIPAEG